MSSRSQSSSSSKRKREEKNTDDHRKRHRSRSTSRERKNSSHSKDRKHSHSKDRHKSKEDRGSRDRKSRHHRDEERKSGSDKRAKENATIKEENPAEEHVPPPPTALPTTVKDEKKEPGAAGGTPAGKKPAIDISSLLSNIKATKAALQQTQKSIKQQTGQKQLQSQQRRLVEVKQKEKEQKDKEEKWKNIEDIQSKINAKLAQMRTQGKIGAPPSSLSLAGGKSFLPPPLLLDEEGREIDHAGKVVSTGPKALVATTMINKRVQREKVFKLEKPTVETDPSKNPYFDPRMKTPKSTRARRGFKFVEAGTYMKKAARMRTKLAKHLLTTTSAAIAAEQEEGGMALLGLGAAGPGGEAAERMELEATGPGLGVNIGVLKKAEEIIKEEEPIPDVEWWDMPILADTTNYGDIGYRRKSQRAEKEEDKEKESNEGSTTEAEPVGLNIKDRAITHLVEHPYILQPPSEKPPPGPMPLKLTKAEQKKMRRRARAERLREQQERVLLGLEKPPPNKVKLSNMMRVLGTEAVQDPTQIEHMVRAEMEQRVRNHEARNQARKLTPAQKRLKKLRKLSEDTSLISTVAVFKVLSLVDEKHRYKVDINAQENNLSGRAVLFGSCNLVVVEGGPKAILRYKKLMLRRIDWNALVAQEEAAAGEEGAEGDAMEVDLAAASGVAKAPSKPAAPTPTTAVSNINNQCWLLWEGSVLKPAFKDFRFEQVFSEKAARKIMKDRRVAHYWDLCKFSRASDAVKIEL